MKISCLSPKEITASVWDELSALRDACPSKRSPLFDPNIARMLGKIRQDTRVLIAETAGAVDAFWPLHVSSDGWARPIAGPFSDWHAPILSASSKHTPISMLSEAKLGGITMHGYQPLPEESADLLEKALAEPDNVTNAVHISNVSEGYEAFLDAQTKQHARHFKKMRRLERNLSRDFSEVSFEFDDRSPKAFEWAINAKREQFQKTGRHDVLAPDWASQYIQSLHALSSPNLKTVLSVLRVDGKIAAAELNLRSNTVLHGWLASINRDFSDYSPGLLLVHGILEAMPQHGLVSYDAGAGLEHYKKYYANELIPQQVLILRTPNAYTASRLAGSVWRKAEAITPPKISNILGKVRRRVDQVLISETELSGRMNGLAYAVKSMGKTN